MSESVGTAEWATALAFHSLLCAHRSDDASKLPVPPNHNSSFKIALLSAAVKAVYEHADDVLIRANANLAQVFLRQNKPTSALYFALSALQSDYADGSDVVNAGVEGVARGVRIQRHECSDPCRLCPQLCVSKCMHDRVLG